MKLKLHHVRLSYPALFKPRGFDQNTPEADKKYEATFLLDKVEHAATIKELRAMAQQMLIDKYGANYPKGFKLCLRDGMDKPDTAGYGEGVMFISSNNDSPPQLVDQQVRPVLTDNGTFYAGCYVNASCRLWIQDNKYGKRINCEFSALQKHSDGEPFGTDSRVDVNEEFAPVGDVDAGLDADGEFSNLL